MNAFRNILVAVDFGEHAAQALDCAIDLAQTQKADVTVLHVFDLGPYAYGIPYLGEDETRAKSELEKTITSHRVKWSRTKGIFRIGVPKTEIVKAAADIKADLIVLGTHGRKGLSRALLGSVAEYVVRTAGVPVLTVPRVEQVARAEGADMTATSKAVGLAAAVDSVLGAVAGAVVGAMAGPAGAVAGAAVGGGIGAAAGAAVQNAALAREEHDQELDRAIGVSGGSIGAAPSGQPPARIGAYSAASAGMVGATETTPAEGPMSIVDDG